MLDSYTYLSTTFELGNTGAGQITTVSSTTDSADILFVEIDEATVNDYFPVDSLYGMLSDIHTTNCLRKHHKNSCQLQLQSAAKIYDALVENSGLATPTYPFIMNDDDALLNNVWRVDVFLWARILR